MGAHSQMLKIRRTKQRNRKIVAAAIKQHEREEKQKARAAAKPKTGA